MEPLVFVLYKLTLFLILNFFKYLNETLWFEFENNFYSILLV